MTNLEYHKGSFCIYNSVFCQEGYCVECEIYLKNRSSVKTEKYQIKTRVVRKARDIVVASAQP
jgi:hypothetical protein